MHPRFVEAKLREALLDTPVVALNGPRQSGKTTLVRHVFGQDRPYLTLDDKTVREAARSDPAGFVRDLDTAIIDEVQRAPDLMMALKQSVDEDRRPGRFLITGSAHVLTIRNIKESLAGRMEVVTLLPLARAEVLEQTPPPFLSRAFAGQAPGLGPPATGRELVELVLAGGYPDVLARSNERRRREWCRNYVEAIASRDAPDIATIDKPGEIPRLISVLARSAGQLFVPTNVGNELGLDKRTVSRYVEILEQLFLVKRLEPWSRNELKRLVKTSKLHFVDSGLLSTVCALNAERIQNDRGVFGAVLETFVFAELQKLASWDDAGYRFYFYRDKDQVEVDFVVENEGGELVGLEVKASATVTSNDFQGLRRLRDNAGKTFKGGIVLYDGEHVLPFGQGMYAAPFSALWSR